MNFFMVCGIDTHQLDLGFTNFKFFYEIPFKYVFFSFV